MWPNTIMQMWGWWSLSRSRVCWFTLILYLAHDGCNPVTCSSRKIYVSTYRSFLTTSGLCRLSLSRQVFNHRVHKPTVLIYPLLPTWLHLVSFMAMKQLYSSSHGFLAPPWSFHNSQLPLAFGHSPSFFFSSSHSRLHLDCHQLNPQDVWTMYPHNYGKHRALLDHFSRSSRRP